jgi:ABC-2 type transport system ATP-binding protein
VGQTRQIIRDAALTATVILSTHILAEVRAICSRVLVLKEGRLVGELDATRATGPVRLRAEVRGPQDVIGQRIGGIAGASGTVVQPAGSSREVLVVDLCCDSPSTVERVAQELATQPLGLRRLAPAEDDLMEAYVRLQSSTPPEG